MPYRKEKVMLRQSSLYEHTKLNAFYFHLIYIIQVFLLTTCDLWWLESASLAKIVIVFVVPNSRGSPSETSVDMCT